MVAASAGRCEAPKGALMPVVHLVVDPTPTAWQRRCASRLAELPATEVRMAAIVAAGADVTIDLAGTAPPGTAWRLVQGDGRPLTAAWPFAEAWSRPNGVARLYLLDEAGRVLRFAAVAANGRVYRRLLQDVDKVAALLPVLAWHDRCHGIRPPDLPPPLPVAARPAAGLLGGGLRYAWARLHEAAVVDLWRVGMADRPIHAFLDPDYVPRVNWLTHSRAIAYCADPFAHPEDPDEIWWEVYCYLGRRGRLQRKRPGVEVETVDLGVDCHQSFPFMTRIAGQSVLVPEMCKSGTTRIYALEPGGQPCCLAVLPVPGIDPVLFEWQGRLWLGLTRADLDNRANLCLWHAPDLTGPWTEHQANPVKIDVRSTRGGGTPFHHQGMLYRPTQDCSLTYGGQVVINRVLACSPCEYREEVAAVVKARPDWPNPHGLHTLSACGDRTLLDAKRVALSGAGLHAKLQRLMGAAPRPPSGSLWAV